MRLPVHAAAAALVLALAAPGHAASPAVERDVPAHDRGAASRTLRWRLLDVTARLDARGDLHVAERHVMLFTGTWNGGERSFRVAPGQRLRLVRVARVDGGVERPLAEGDLAEVDRWAWAPGGSHVLRWRSRSPSDPAFAGTELTYVLEYVLEGALAATGDGLFRLAHDFGFSHRPGPIETLRARLELDPAWDPGSSRLALERRDLQPWDGAVLVAAFRWTGQGPAPFGPGPLTEPQWWALAAAMAAALAAAAAWVLRHAGARGLLAAGPRPAIDEAWLRAHVLAHPPEVIGAAWDGRVGGPEVSAVLARLAAEGKLEARVERAFLGREVHLRLLVDRATLPARDRSLVDALFFDDDTTDSRRLRAHYRRTGFDPSRRLQGLDQAAERLVPKGSRGGGRAVAAAVPLLLAAAAGLAWLAAERGEARDALALVLYGWPFLVLVVTASWFLSAGVTRLWARAVPAAVSLVGAAALVGWLGSPGLGIGRFTVLVYAVVWGIGLLLSAWLARTPLTAEGVAARLRLVAARRHLARELEQARPRLDDAWIPYLLALGLGRGLDRWVRVHGSSPGASSGAAGSFSGGGTRWTGGGGGFSGGGASGSWAALGSFAAGVPSPSRSGSGGGGGGGGSRSGGGGGGGW